MSDSTFKFIDLQSLYGLVDVQVEVIPELIKQEYDEENKKFLKKELMQMKSLKTKLSKLIKEY